MSNKVIVFTRCATMTTSPDILAKIAATKETRAEELDLSGTYHNRGSLTTIPEEVSKLEWLVRLKINWHYIKEIPEHLSRLTNLQELNLNDNQIKEIPEHLSCLSNLEYLGLGVNQIKEIPEHLSRLSKLQQLRLWDNQIKKIPASVVNLPNLIAFDVNENPIASPPPEIVAQGLEGMRNYFQQLWEEGSDYLYEAKLIIVGEAGAGKLV
ncbi:MAG: leucine-rich repeat domain-containing protein [Synechococcaceae cyanobacterium RL_1_2]|nr:leucine-rich repeat domain-containing protein [Synechococcaceae cyanobacterium RL_1_2]